MCIHIKIIILLFLYVYKRKFEIKRNQKIDKIDVLRAKKRAIRKVFSLSENAYIKLYI